MIPGIYYRYLFHFDINFFHKNVQAGSGSRSDRIRTVIRIRESDFRIRGSGSVRNIYGSERLLADLLEGQDKCMAFLDYIFF
jgi:hypothetical protein